MVRRSHPGALQSEHQAVLDTFNTAVLALELSPRHFVGPAQEGPGQGGAARRGQGRRGRGRGGGGEGRCPRAPPSGSSPSRSAAGGAPPRPSWLPKQGLKPSFGASAMEQSQEGTPAPGALALGRPSESEPSKSTLSPHFSVRGEGAGRDSFLLRSPRSATGPGPSPFPPGTAPLPLGDFRRQGSQGSPAPDSEHSLRNSPTMGSERA